MRQDPRQARSVTENGAGFGVEPETGVLPQVRVVGIDIGLAAEDPVRLPVSIHIAWPGQIITVVVRIQRHGQGNLPHIVSTD